MPSTATLTIYDEKHLDTQVVLAFLKHITLDKDDSSLSIVQHDATATPPTTTPHTMSFRVEGDDPLFLYDSPLTIIRCMASLTLQQAPSDRADLLSELDAVEWAKVREWTTFVRVDFAQLTHPAKKDVLLRLLDKYLAIGCRTFVASPHRATIADLFLFVYLRESVVQIAQKTKEYAFVNLCRYYNHLQKGPFKDVTDMSEEAPVTLFAGAETRRPVFKFVPRVAKANAAAAEAKAKKQQGKGGAADGKEGASVKQSKEEKKKKKKGDEKKKPVAAAPAGSTVPVPISALELRAGKIVSVKRHPDADGLYIERIDAGEENQRTVCSGLVGKVNMEEKVGTMVLVATNLKPSVMRGVESSAMVMAATNADGAVELVSVPEGVKPGERVAVDNFPGEPDARLNSKRLVKILPLLKTADNGEVVFAEDKNVLRFPSNGKAVSSSFKGASVK